jgi:competence protein ComGC
VDLLGNRSGIGHAEWNSMKPHCSIQRNNGLTLVEVLVILIVLAFLAVTLLPKEPHARTKARWIICASQLKEIGLAYRIWEGDNGNLYPMSVSVTNGGAMELAQAGDAARIFQVMSNELSRPEILLCPADTDHSRATNFSVGFSAKNTSYFANLNAAEANPQSILSGDDNFEIGGDRIESGQLELTTNTLITWSRTRHKFAGNIGLTDGSVRQLTISGLQQAFQNSGSATNRILIP